MSEELCPICHRPLPYESAEIYQRHEIPDLIAKVGGHWTGPALQHILQCEVAAGLERNDPRKFPGAQPVSFAACHFEELKREDYYVCEKTDGLRVLMYLSSRRIALETLDPDQPEVPMEPICYFADRRNNYYSVPGLRFPHQDDPTFQRYHIATFLDGELVEDKPPNVRPIMKFLAFDLLVVDEKDLRERPLDKRLGYLKEWILKPYQKYMATSKDVRDSQPFLFEDKKTEFSYSLQTMFNDIIPKVKLLHGNDGLIFTCRATSYQSGTDKHILKWKPPNENTIDFLMHIKWAMLEPDPSDPDQTLQEDYYTLPTRFDLYIFHGNGNYGYVDELYVTQDDWEEMKSKAYPLQDAIVECFVEDSPQANGHNGTNGTNGQNRKRRWRFHRLREDKDEANHVSTYDSVKESIHDNVTQQLLLDRAEEIRAAWKARHARASNRPG